jgi:hypothetical protein
LVLVLGLAAGSNGAAAPISAISDELLLTLIALTALMGATALRWRVSANR